jgi:hypothetical protein
LVVEDEMNGPVWRARTMAELAFVAEARGGSSGRAEAQTWRDRAELLASQLGFESLLTIQRGDQLR